MREATLKDRVEKLLYTEAALLDEKRWREWLELYADDAVFWMPTWTSEYEMTQDPELGLNLLYLKGKAGLEDRVFRIETGDSFASVPMARTTHLVGNVIIRGEGPAGLDVRANWIVHSYGLHGGITRSGAYEYLLRDTDSGLRIARKKISMIDDKLVGPVDVFHV